MNKTKDTSRGSSEEKSLFNEMKRLAKVTNQRMLRIERLTGVVGGFASKELIDKLSAEPLQAITKKGRVAVRKDFTDLQMKAIIRAMNKFINEPISKTRGLKSYVKQLSEDVKDTITFEQANVYFIARGHFKWIIDYFASSFWDLARESVIDGWSEETFSQKVGAMLDKPVDESIKQDLIDLYEYTRNVKV